MDFAADCAYEKPKNFHKREFGLHLATIVVPDIPIYSAKLQLCSAKAVSFLFMRCLMIYGRFYKLVFNVRQCSCFNLDVFTPLAPYLFDFHSVT